MCGVLTVREGRWEMRPSTVAVSSTATETTAVPSPVSAPLALCKLLAMGVVAVIGLLDLLGTMVATLLGMCARQCLPRLKVGSTNISADVAERTCSPARGLIVVRICCVS